MWFWICASLIATVKVASASPLRQHSSIAFLGFAELRENVALRGSRIAMRPFQWLLFQIAQLLQQLLHVWWSAPARQDIQWREMPQGAIEALLSDLKPTTQAQYRKVLAEFQSWATGKRLRLFTLQDVDRAAYEFVGAHARGKGEYLIAALLRVYPHIRGHLFWTVARMKVVASHAQRVHHLPMPWLVCVGIAWVCAVEERKPRRAAALLLQWRFGLRPRELLDVIGDDLYVAPPGGGMSFLRVGGRRGTKARRPQVVRAWDHDWFANFLLRLFRAATEDGSPLCDITVYHHWAALIARLVARLFPDFRWTPHCLRAGWATHRHTSGQSFVELREDGRWASDASLRVYLDVVATANILSDPSIAPLLQWLLQLERQMSSWLVF